MLTTPSQTTHTTLSRHRVEKVPNFFPGAEKLFQEMAIGKFRGKWEEEGVCSGLRQKNRGDQQMLTTSLQTLHTHNTRGGEKGSRNFSVGKKNLRFEGIFARHGV